MDTKELSIYVGGMVFQLILSYMLNGMDKRKAMILNFASGLLFWLIYLSFNVLMKAFAIVLVNYAATIYLSSISKRLMFWTIIFGNILFYCGYYTIASDFSFDKYLLGIFVWYIFSMQRITFVAAYIDKNPEELSLFSPLTYFFYIFGLIGSLTGPFFDFINYKAIFLQEKDGKNTIQSDIKLRRKYLIKFLKISALYGIAVWLFPYILEHKNIREFNNYFYTLSAAMYKMKIIFLISFGYLSQINIGYDISLLLEKHQQNKDLEPISLSNGFFCLAPRQFISNWNFFVVQWLGYLFKDKFPIQYVGLVCIGVSVLWHGPNYGYIITGISVYSIYVINIKWSLWCRKNDTSIKRLYKEWTKSTSGKVFCFIITYLILDYISLPFFEMDKSVIFERSKIDNNIPLFALYLTGFLAHFV